MNTPPFLIGAALIFWGWQSGLWWLGAGAALMLEASRFVRARWEFAQTDLDRIWNLCVLLFFGAAVVAFISNDGIHTVTSMAADNSMAKRTETLNKGARSVIQIFLWMPLAFLPIAVAQAFSERERMPWSTFSWWLRRQRIVAQKVGHGKTMLPPSDKEAGFNVTWPYFAICLIAASAANERTLQFSIGLALLTGWALWTRRRRSFPMATWLACWVAAIALGFGAQFGMRELQRLAQRLDSALVARFAGGRGFDPKESRTMLGGIGRMKLSGSIVLRVEADGSPPSLLREASYNLFRSPYWAAPKEDLVTMNSELDLTTWKLLPNKPAKKSVLVSGYLSSGNGLLAVPHGVATLEQLPANQLKTNRMGVLSVEDGPGLVRFRALYDYGASFDSKPDTNDRDLPVSEKAVAAQVVDELKLRGLDVEEALRRVARHFADHFQYTTWLGDERRSRDGETPLSKFLLKTHAGHCEYFATATVMLLREAGIPARYAVGYSVQEKKGDQWIVRERHAHAWCLAWVDGAWREVDNTPASWVVAEATRASWWETISDDWSRVWFEFSKWRWGDGGWKRYLIWLVVPLLGLAGWRLMSQKQWSRARQKSDANSSMLTRPGMDSEFFLVERRLLELGLERHEAETLSAWLKRIKREGTLDSENLAELLAMHYRLRFDPAGLGVEQRAVLRSQSTEWLERSASSQAAR